MEILMSGLHIFSVDPLYNVGAPYLQRRSQGGEFAPRQSLGQDVRDVVSGGHLANLDEFQRLLLPDEVNQHQEVFRPFNPRRQRAGELYRRVIVFHDNGG